MLSMGMFMTIITLWKQGKSKSEIARIVQHDRKTVSKVIREYETKNKERPSIITKKSIVEPYKEEIIQYLERGLSGVRIHEELIPQGLTAKYRTLSEYIFKLKSRQKICVRFHTEPGNEAQVDFGYAGLQPHPGGNRKKGWIFCMRLSYSRFDYYEVVFDQKVQTFIECHINAFKYYQGVPKTVKIDNLKAAILEAHFYDPMYQELYKQFSEFYGFNPIPCRVRKPQEKGKVESGIKYVKNNFFAGRKFETYDSLVERLNEWRDNKCNVRIHGTTKKKPKEIFESEEKDKLLRLPIQEYVYPQLGRRKVHTDCHVVIESNYYSVPFEYVGKMVEVQQDNKLVRILSHGKQIAVHTKKHTVGDFITNKAHYPKYKAFSYDSEEYRSMYKKKMSDAGHYVGEFYQLLIEQQPYTWYRTAKGVLSLKKEYSETILNLACKRALAFNTTSYRRLKNICAQGSYNLPIDIYEDTNDERIIN